MAERTISINFESSVLFKRYFRRYALLNFCYKLSSIASSFTLSFNTVQVGDISRRNIRADGLKTPAGSGVGSPGGLLDLQTACTSWMYTATEAETSAGSYPANRESGESSFKIEWLRI